MDLVPVGIKDLIPISFHNSYQIKGRESIATGRDWSESWCTSAGISEILTGVHLTQHGIVLEAGMDNSVPQQTH